MAQFVILNSINAQTGKTLLAAHLSTMLVRDYKVAVLDSAGENSALALFTAKRYTLNLSSDYNLPVAPYFSLATTDLEKLKTQYDLLILDSPAEKYFKYADIFITPLRGEEGVNSVAQKNSLYASLLWEAKKQRAANGQNSFRWIVVPNDVYDNRQIEELKNHAPMLGYKIAPRLQTRLEYASGLSQGLTAPDKDLPRLKPLFSLADMHARREIKKLAEFIWQNK